MTKVSSFRAPAKFKLNRFFPREAGRGEKLSLFLLLLLLLFFSFFPKNPKTGRQARPRPGALRRGAQPAVCGLQERHR